MKDHTKQIEDLIDNNVWLQYGDACFYRLTDKELDAVKAMYEENKRLRDRIAELEKEVNK